MKSNDSKFKGISCSPRPGEDSERFIKRFQRKVRNEGVLQEAYLRSYYEKPSVKRRRKSNHARFMKNIEDGK